MRQALSLVVLLTAARAHASNIVTPGPPANPADYIVLGLGWEEPPYALARARGPGNDFIPIAPNQNIWVPRNAGGPPSERGLFDIRYGTTPDVPWTFTIPFAPEMDSRFSSFTVHLGYDNYVNGPRLIQIAGPGVYFREVTVQQTPAPASWTLASLGGAALMRRRRGR
jgi:MYXO-CTERM domain-containing protein